MIRPILLMIRPEKPARSFVQAFTEVFIKEFEVLYCPLIGIESLSFDLRLDGITLILFTSVNGVEQFATRTPNRNIPVLCVGETTRKAAIAAGFQAESAHGTATSLLAKTLATYDPRCSRILYIRGTEVSFDMLTALKSAGFHASQAILYRQYPLPFSQNSLAILATKPTVIPIFSANGAKALLAAIDPTSTQNITVLCISPKVTACFSNTPTFATHTADKPTRIGMINALIEIM